MHKKIKSYMNQVGRHCCLLTRESSHGELIILKPAVKREVDFYQDHLPRLSGLQAFVPRYYGLEEPGSPAAGVGNQVNQVADTCSSSSLLCRQTGTSVHNDGKPDSCIHSSMCEPPINVDPTSSSWAMKSTQRRNNKQRADQITVPMSARTAASLSVCRVQYLI